MSDRTLVPKIGGTDIPWGWRYFPIWRMWVCAPMCVRGMWLPYCVVVTKSYLVWRAGVSCKTLSKMLDSWYFPRFLLRDGSLTQMSMASLMVQYTMCSPCLQWKNGKAVTLIGCTEEQVSMVLSWRCQLSPLVAVSVWHKLVTSMVCMFLVSVTFSQRSDEAISVKIWWRPV